MQNVIAELNTLDRAKCLFNEDDIERYEMNQNEME